MLPISFSPASQFFSEAGLELTAAIWILSLLFKLERPMNLEKPVGQTHVTDEDRTLVTTVSRRRKEGRKGWIRNMAEADKEVDDSGSLSTGSQFSQN